MNELKDRVATLRRIYSGLIVFIVMPIILHYDELVGGDLWKLAELLMVPTIFSVMYYLEHKN